MFFFFFLFSYLLSGKVVVKQDEGGFANAVGTKQGFFEACLAGMACCCCLDILF
jgi:hypothetical protein